jgi:hypothetical protein
MTTRTRNGKPGAGHLRRMPIRTARVQLEGEYADFSLGMRANPPLRVFTEIQANPDFATLRAIVQELIVDWDFVDDPRRRRPGWRPRSAANRPVRSDRDALPGDDYRLGCSPKSLEREIMDWIADQRLRPEPSKPLPWQYANVLIAERFGKWPEEYEDRPADRACSRTRC